MSLSRVGRRSVPLVAAVAVAAGVILAPQAAQATLPPGWLDPTYGSSGVAVAPGSSTADQWAGAVDSSGRAVLLSSTGGSPAQDEVTRMAVDGSVDPGFGTSGSTDLPLGPSYQTLIVGSDGIYVLGTSQNGDNAVVAKLNTDGTADSSYGTGGLATVDLPTAIDGVGRLTQLSSGDVVLSAFHENSAPDVD